VVNVDARESATTRMTAAEFEGMLDRISLASSTAGEGRAQQTEARQSYWRYGLLLMLITLAAESFIGRA
jgi:zona occludens toxin (predicted ATPase)